MFIVASFMEGDSSRVSHGGDLQFKNPEFLKYQLPDGGLKQ
jgi:hypothetical protein